MVSIILEQIKNYLFLHQAPLLQALNQYLFIKKRQQYHKLYFGKMFTVYLGDSSITPQLMLTHVLPITVLNLGQYRTAPGGGGIEVPARTVINATTTLWFYIPGQSCTDNLQFTITVNITPLPIFTNTAAQCDVYYLPPVAGGNYFTGPLEPEMKEP
jgi:hypothetical protein